MFTWLDALNFVKITSYVLRLIHDLNGDTFAQYIICVYGKNSHTIGVDLMEQTTTTKRPQ
jgi:hypothetical protein